jgi:hypothetical protein
MSRIPVPTRDQAPAASRPLLDSVQANLGMTPNFIRALANSPAMCEVSNGQFEAAKTALSDEEIVETIAHVALNVFTNLLGKSTRIPIDFPAVPLLKAA